MFFDLQIEIKYIQIVFPSKLIDDISFTNLACTINDERHPFGIVFPIGQSFAYFSFHEIIFSLQRKLENETGHM